MAVQNSLCTVSTRTNINGRKRVGWAHGSVGVLDVLSSSFSSSSSSPPSILSKSDKLLDLRSSGG
eukprot:30815-Eustigmatos_ZCMA.PRE.1